MEAHRITLVRCLVRNQQNELSTRYIERSHFRMWQFLMANRHRLTVEQAAVCLWLPEIRIHKTKGRF